MAQVPYPITENDAAGIKRQVWNLIRDLYEERMAGLTIGDVFADEGDVLSLQLAATAGLDKVDNELTLEVKADGGLQLSTTGVAIKCKAAGGLATDANGVYVDSTNILLGGSQSASDTSGTIAINWALGATVYVTLTGTGRTVTFANPVNGQVYRLRLLQGNGGSKTITTWPDINWQGGSAPTLSTSVGLADWVTLVYWNSTYDAQASTGFS